MYDELVKRLRKEAVKWCANCCYKCGDNVCGAPDDRKKDCDVYTKLHAADAIEELICEVADEHNARLDAEERQRWIPVSEQLIHSGWYLVACNEWGGSAVRKAIYDEATRKWLEFPCGGPKDITKFVTHYMPLPDPPKEET